MDLLTIRISAAIVGIVLIIGISADGYAEIHKGVFIRFSPGIGYNAEFAGISKSAFTTPAKNHAIGWSFGERYALQISDFGGLIKNKVKEYNYVNLDGFGPGFTYYMPLNTYVSFSI